MDGKQTKKSHAKKMIAPIVITILVLAYWGVWLVLLALTADRAPWMILVGLVVLAMAAGLVYVLIQRIREIRKGEEDDLDNY